ncbi:hypothetical protein [Clostridium sp. UBA6640]|uniref:hypothetical protein n=1 Tax=Clostridium sp. UBA6640 TaxID=1946370 RepID=UPI0025BCFD8D|nr:hypothetical protein [Clostridium sp. UBA6640]
MDLQFFTHKKRGNLTNAEAAKRYGLASVLDEEGNVGTLHPYKDQLNILNLMSKEVRKAFPKVDSIEYWKIRGEMQ